LDGVDLRDLNVLSLHQIMGLVQQDTQLFNLTIQENISYGTEGATLFDVQEAARMANCHDFIMGFEDQYQTRVGERGVRLSGGQKQRISIARVFLRKPRLLFLDEATSALDTESEAAVQGALDILMKSAGCTVVLVAHRLSTVVNADKIAVVMDGEIAEQGSHEELVALEGHYFKLVSRQISRQKNKIEHDGNNAKELDTIDGLESDQKEDPDAADVIDKLAKD
jgi:ABC-type multidrug transport system fused ATPase/permease subunit